MNFETGEIRIFAADDPIGDDWVEVTPFFSGVFRDGQEVIVDRTIKGAAELVKTLGGSVGNETATSFTLKDTNTQIRALLRKMRMFLVDGKDVSY